MEIYTGKKAKACILNIAAVSKTYSEYQDQIVASVCQDLLVQSCHQHAFVSCIKATQVQQGNMKSVNSAASQMQGTENSTDLWKLGLSKKKKKMVTALEKNISNCK